MSIQVRELLPEDIDIVVELWTRQVEDFDQNQSDDGQTNENQADDDQAVANSAVTGVTGVGGGVGVVADDCPFPLRRIPEPQEVADYLLLYPGQSLVAHMGGKMVGVLLCGYDGRWAALHRLMVSESARSDGVERLLLDKSLIKQQAAGIHRCHFRVTDQPELERSFWQSVRWTEMDGMVNPNRRRADARRDVSAAKTAPAPVSATASVACDSQASESSELPEASVLSESSAGDAG